MCEDHFVWTTSSSNDNVTCVWEREWIFILYNQSHDNGNGWSSLEKGSNIMFFVDLIFDAEATKHFSFHLAFFYLHKKTKIPPSLFQLCKSPLPQRKNLYSLLFNLNKSTYNNQASLTTFMILFSLTVMKNYILKSTLKSLSDKLALKKSSKWVLKGGWLFFFDTSFNIHNILFTLNTAFLFL